MKEKIVVSGMGICSALGMGLQNNFKKLEAGSHGFSSLDFLETIYKNDFPFGEIKMSMTSLQKHLNERSHQSFTRTSLLGIIALEEALLYAGLHSRKPFRIAFLNATTVGSMCEVEKHYFDFLDPTKISQKNIETIDCADCTQRIADYFQLNDFISTISTACSSSTNAIILGNRLLQHDIVDIAICGGTDALTRFTINGFQALKNIDKHYCRPFDANRNGLNLGEGAAYLILEKQSLCEKRNQQPLAYLKGYCNFNESFHPTAPNPQGEGAYRVMKKAIEKASLQANDIDYINAHGTATLTNDESESNAMKRLFHDVPKFSSTKSYTGHTLGAAGAIEAVFSILSLQNQCVYANLNFETAIEDSLLIPQLQFESIKLKYVMSNSFAFGGNNASLIFSTYQ